ncbi:hypothetical protein BJV82DRAFT_659021 [Fennellomyces sp. T-0311]|nr:hypothetical protein BJV82DRAFT_659021 [Fennellomyces sp. T-0311]
MHLTKKHSRIEQLATLEIVVNIADARSYDIEGTRAPGVTDQQAIRKTSFQRPKRSKVPEHHKRELRGSRGSGQFAGNYYYGTFWKIGRINLSTKLNDFRNKAMGKVHLGDTRLSRSELLAINYIYYFDAGERNDIFRHLLHLSDNVLEAVAGDIDRDDQYKPLSSQSKECLDIFEEV